jgi:hypothetical protein
MNKNLKTRVAIRIKKVIRSRLLDKRKEEN